MPTSPPQGDKVNPLQLTGLKQAIFVLKCMHDGITESEIVDLFHGDKQLVEIWKGFLIHNHWMAQPDGKWIATAKGEEWIGKYSL